MLRCAVEVLIPLLLAHLIVLSLLTTLRAVHRVVGICIGRRLHPSYSFSAAFAVATVGCRGAAVRGQQHG
jgi:hypothetical protein